ncbi:DsbA family protein [Paenibacillus sp. OAS669]|uniref:DsbA family protein n=1 Tax=Paenibacillus sp. OAS669 TaxID=2663821 RepID=UPI001A0D851F|nr:thioredoxin domain-containing protein [Paenibacillus sp. OAS669]MBE1444926.1 protein-disulfide isomerase [Paenibacillus sp. OAS669]
MKQTTKKSVYKEQRKQEKIQEKKRMRMIMWITAICVIAVIAIIIVALPKPAPVQMPYETMPTLGNPDAPVKIVELGDYKCPSCQVFSQKVEPLLKKDFIDTGIASLHFMNYTIISPEADSMTSAMAGQAIFHQNNDAYWKYYDAIYKNQGDEKKIWATTDFITNLARQEKLPIDYDKLKQDIENKTYKKEVDAHNAFARSNQVYSTPTLFINGKKFEDPFDYNKLKAAIEKAQKGE